jgi:nucleoside-diphosphate-sugar epimerase
MIPAFSAADIVIQAANPGYLGIVAYLPKLCEAVLDAAEATARKVVFLEGVYTYGRNPGHPVAEDFAGKPHTRKGRTKYACAERILAPIWKRLSAMIVRMPDYYGPTSQMAFLDATLSALASRKFGIFIGTKKPRREYIYLPDAAERIARLALDEDAYGQVWNISGVHLSGEEILAICREHLGYKSTIEHENAALR